MTYSFDTLARENRICCSKGDVFVSRNCKEMEVKALLRDQMETYRQATSVMIYSSSSV